jgi:hypothetical protein
LLDSALTTNALDDPVPTSVVAILLPRSRQTNRLVWCRNLRLEIREGLS